MSPVQRFVPVLLAALTIGCGCSDSKSTNPPPAPVSGKITASAVGLPLQQGNVYAVAAYDYDWQPGATGPAVAGFRTSIGEAEFGSTEILHTVDGQGTPTATEYVFAPGTYSVVFFVAVPDHPPQNFVEIRVTVNGDQIAQAPAWGQWTHTR